GRPGGNLTGITLDAGIEIWAKRLQMLKEAIPSASNAAFLGMREGWEDSCGQFLRDTAGRLGISLAFLLPQQGTPSEIERVFAAMAQQRPEAVQVSGEGILYANRRLIVELAEKNRLPVMCPYRDYVEAGGLMAYAVDLAELLRRMANDVHEILKGTKPGEIPIYQPTKFDLLINLKTAKTFGLALPPALLAHARRDHRIERCGGDESGRCLSQKGKLGYARSADVRKATRSMRRISSCDDLSIWNAQSRMLCKLPNRAGKILSKSKLSLLPPPSPTAAPVRAHSA